MKRKRNTLATILVILATILVLTCTGCTDDDLLTTYKQSDRFTVERYYYGDSVMPDLYIITDTETGAQYLYAEGYKAGGLTVLQPGEDTDQ